MKQLLSISFFLLILLNSCSQKNSPNLDTERPSKHYNLALIDSIKIPYLGRPILQDLSPSTQKILFIEFRETELEIFVADFSGQILHSFIANGHTIIGNLRLIAPLHLENKGNTIISFGSPHVKRISIDGTKVETIFTGIPPYYSAFPSPTNELIKRNNKIFYNNRSDDGTFNRYQKEYLQNLKLIGYLDLDKSETTNFLSFP